MKELSIFVDESGDFGEYNHISPYYLVTLILHEQEKSIIEQVKMLDLCLDNINIDRYHWEQDIKRVYHSLYKILSGYLLFH